MIRTIHMQNFKCLHDVKVDLGMFNVLIGPNDSGKTSLLDAIYLLGETTRRPWSEVFSGDYQPQKFVWEGDVTAEIKWDVEGPLDDTGFSYSFSIMPGSSFCKERLSCGTNRMVARQSLPDGTTQYDIVSSYAGDSRTQNTRGQSAFFTVLRNSPRPPFFDAVQRSFASSQKFDLSPQSLRRATKLEANCTLSPSGDNLVAVLDQIFTGPNGNIRIELENALQEAIPTVRGIYLPIVDQNQQLKKLDFTLAMNGAQPQTIPSALASDGAVIVTAFLALAYGDTPEILLIEEPDKGLHPTLMNKVVELLRKMSTGEVGNRARQIILTTHSPILLNYVEPHEVRIFRRYPKTGTNVTPMDQVPGIERLRKEFATGALWNMLGEEGLLEEAPA